MRPHLIESTTDTEPNQLLSNNVPFNAELLFCLADTSLHSSTSKGIQTVRCSGSSTPTANDIHVRRC